MNTGRQHFRGSSHRDDYMVQEVRMQLNFNQRRWRAFGLIRSEVPVENHAADILSVVNISEMPWLIESFHSGEMYDAIFGSDIGALKYYC